MNQWKFSNTLALLSPANEVWDKVMFLHLSVSHSLHMGGVMMSLPVMDSTFPWTASTPRQYLSCIAPPVEYPLTVSLERTPMDNTTTWSK